MCVLSLGKKEKVLFVLSATANWRGKLITLLETREAETDAKKKMEEMEIVGAVGFSEEFRAIK